MKTKLWKAISLCLVCALLPGLSSCAIIAARLEGATEGDSVAGQYFFFEDGVMERTSYITLTDEEWTAYNEGMTFGGRYTLDGGQLTMLYTVNADEPRDQELMEAYGVRDGETVEMYSGSVAVGRMVLDVMMGERQSDEVVLYASYVVEGRANTSARYDGIYSYTGGENGVDAYFQLIGTQWMLHNSGEIMVGTYGVFGGELVMFCALGSGSGMEQELVAEYRDLRPGDVVILFGGSIGGNTIILDELMEEKQSPAMVFTRLEE